MQEEAEDIMRCFRPFFEDSEIKKVWHNYSFDRHVMHNMGIDCRGFAGDTMHMARLLDASRRLSGGYSLEGLSRFPHFPSALPPYPFSPSLLFRPHCSSAPSLPYRPPSLPFRSLTALPPSFAPIRSASLPFQPSLNALQSPLLPFSPPSLPFSPREWFWRLLGCSQGLAMFFLRCWLPA